MTKRALLDLLQSEVQRTTGCTDPGSVALAVARAVRELGSPAAEVHVIVSPGVFKNGMGVGIPGTGERGLVLAAALGALIGRPDAGLAIFDFVTPVVLAEAQALVAADRVSVTYAPASDPLSVRASVSAAGQTAHALIQGDYTNVVEVGVNGQVKFSSGVSALEERDTLAEVPLETLFRLVETMVPEELEFLHEAARINRQAAEVGLAAPTLKLGRSLNSPVDLPLPFSAIHRAQVWTAAASEARMAGYPVAVMAIAGSGNHGITFTLGLLAVAETLGSSREQLGQALAYGALVTVVIKSHVRRMTAFCGCAVAASTGVAAGTVSLLGGDFAAAERAMQTVIGTLAGLLCDGAKESCAYKLSHSVSLAIQSAFGATDGASIPGGMGIVGGTIDQSFANLARLNNPGMVATDQLVLQLIQEGQAR